jgi:predicted HicB family RNase H-like nuclease
VKPDVHHRAKSEAALANLALQDWVEQALIEKLQKRNQEETW